jgi:hypothetical protein
MSHKLGTLPVVSEALFLHQRRWMHGLIHGIIAAASILCPSQNGPHVIRRKARPASFLTFCVGAHTQTKEKKIKADRHNDVKP